MSVRDPDTDDLLDSAVKGDRAARQQLLSRHRGRLRKMVAYHLDHRLAARVDPSDVVQEALLEAEQELADYLKGRPVPFYPWLRQLAWDQLVGLHRRHLHAGKRSVCREQPGFFNLSDESRAQLAGRLVDLGSSPSRQSLRQEVRTRVRAALDRLPARDVSGWSQSSCFLALDTSTGARLPSSSAQGPMPSLPS
jgi:RNA polymerase sigma-70 factor (ECF subfamily)